ncbi:MAG: helix-turn-helix transcriptional regulator, partial [Gordonibacter sp.]
PDKKAVGRRIRSWCVDSGKTYEDVATDLGMPTTTLKAWVYGERNMSFDMAGKIADYFGKSLDELACRDMRKAS